MNKHRKKMMAPILVTVVVVLYYLFYFGILITLVEGWWKLLLGVIPLLLAGLMIAVCCERIREINKGEEDDLSQY